MAVVHSAAAVVPLHTPLAAAAQRFIAPDSPITHPLIVLDNATVRRGQLFDA